MWAFFQALAPGHTEATLVTVVALAGFSAIVAVSRRSR